MSPPSSLPPPLLPSLQPSVCLSFLSSFFLHFSLSVCELELLISHHREREGPVDGREATRCSSVTNRWRTPVLALTAQLAANEPTASLASSAVAARLRVRAPAAASLSVMTRPPKKLSANTSVHVRHLITDT